MPSNRTHSSHATFGRPSCPAVAPAARRTGATRAALGTLVAVGVLCSPTGASARTQQLGTARGPSSTRPSCPGLPCQALTRATGFQAAVNGGHNAAVVRLAGWVTSWTITLAKPTADEASFFDKLTGGPPEAALVILRQGANYRFRVVGVTPVVALMPFLGQTQVMRLAAPLAVLPGEVLGLSVPTWAPALALGLSAATAWRASRAHGNCGDVTKPTFVIHTGNLGRFQCVYRNGRLTYGATITSTPPRPALPVRPSGPGQPASRPLSRR